MSKLQLKIQNCTETIRYWQSQTGQSLIELLMAIALAAVLLPAALTGFISSREGKAQQNQRLQAVPLLKEAEEAVRIAREKNWNTFAVNGTYHPEISANTWSLVTGVETMSGFTRSVAISDVSPPDPSTKKIVTTVSWNTPFSSAATSTMYLTRYLGNTIFTQTTQADFNAGIKTGVIVTNTSGGEVVLGAGGNANWCEPNLSIAALDLPKQGIANAISAIEGKVFAGTGENASGVSFANVAISNDKPPVATVSGTLDGYKTNDVFGETAFAYLATDNNAKEVIIIDLTSQDENKKYSEVGYFNAPGNGNGESVFVSGNVGYMLSSAGTYKLYTFDLSSKAGARPVLDADGVTLTGEGKEVFVVGNYAYVAVDLSSTQLQIIDVTNPANLTVVGQASVLGGEGKDVFVNSTGTRAYLATENSTTQKELFIIDTSTKTGSRPTIGNYEANGMDPKGITVVPGSRALLVGTGNEEYQAINIANETQPVRCGGLNIDTGVNGISSILETDGDAYSYIITGDANSELKIIEGGPGGAFSQTGTFESNTFDATASAAFNRFAVTINKPFQTNITFQVSGADANQGTGNCTDATFTFVGPDGTSNTQFATSSAIPTSVSGGYKNPARCFRYKAFLSTTDFTQSPTLYDMTVNYSP